MSDSLPPSAVWSPASTQVLGLIGRGGHGLGLGGPPPQPRHARRHQVHRPRVRREQGGVRALRHRGARRGDDPEQARHPDLRPRRDRRRTPVHGHGAPRSASRSTSASTALGRAPACGRPRGSSATCAARCSARTTRASSTATSSRRTSSSSASPDDDDEIAKVLDFGIAKIKAPPGEQGLSSSTKTGRGARHAVLHVARAGARPAQHRPPLRPLVARRHRAQVRDGRLALRGRERRRSAREDLHVAGAHAVGDGARACRRRSTRGSSARSSASRRAASRAPRSSRTRWRSPRG